MAGESRTDDVRVGLIGYGFAGVVFHGPLIEATPGIRMAVVVTSDAGRAEQARQAHPGVRVVASADELWARPGDVDVVVVATANRAHVSLARAAIAAGLPVVVEKPMAATADEARALVAEARARGVLLTVFQNRRWDGDFLTVTRLLAEGRLGRPLRFESRFDRWRLHPKGGWRDRGGADEAGGLLYDIGSHLIDQALQLFGPAAHVYAELDQRRSGVEVDDDVCVAITHRSGVRSQLYMSVVNAQPGLRMRVLGSEAAYVKDGLDVQENALKAGGVPGSAGWGEEPSDRWGLVGAADVVDRVRTEPGAYQRFYEGLVAALRRGAPPPVDPNDAVAALEVIDAARVSAREASVVTLA